MYSNARQQGSITMTDMEERHAAVKQNGGALEFAPEKLKTQVKKAAGKTAKEF
jgi:hypothetical protein